MRTQTRPAKIDLNLLWALLVFTLAGGSYFLAVPSRGENQEVKPYHLQSSLSGDTVRIGDPVTYYLRLTAPAPTEVVFPPYEEKGIEGLEIKATGAGTAESGEEKLWEQWYVLKSFTLGLHPLPPPQVLLRGADGKEETLSGIPLTLQVNSLIDPAQPPEDIRDIKDPLVFQTSYRRLILLLGGGIALLTLVALVAIKTLGGKEKISPPPPPRPPHEVAYEELERIKSENLPGRGEIEKYYIRVSDVVRHYLENRFRLRAPEMTTEEFLVEMATTNRLSLPHQELVGNFLAHCDLVKFARYGPTEKEIEDVYDSAVHLVDETKDESKQ